jgi:hypothetical protein
VVGCKTEPVTIPPVVELIRSSELTDRAPYTCAAVVHDASRLIFTASACPLDGGGAIVAVGNVTRAQTPFRTMCPASTSCAADLALWGPDWLLSSAVSNSDAYDHSRGRLRRFPKQLSFAVRCQFDDRRGKCKAVSVVGVNVDIAI